MTNDRMRWSATACLLPPGLVAAALLVLATGAQAADAPRREDFAWRASLAVPAGAGLARVPLPPEALARLQSADARDLRVFNAAGEPVAFSLAGAEGSATQLAPQFTPAYAALPLFAARADGRAPAKGAVQVKVDGAGQAVWVKVDGAVATDASTASTPPAATPLRSALFDTRSEAQALTALRLQAELPANVPVQLTAATSNDLAQWTPLPLRGSLYRFEGAAGAPANDLLELEQPQSLQGRYLRLDWSGFDGVRIIGLTGRVAQATPQPVRPEWALPAGTPQGKTALEWPLGFATPVSALALRSDGANVWVPVRVLGRREPGQAWLPLAQGVVYRLSAAGAAAAVSPAIALPRAGMRWLRLESTHGMELPAGLQAAVQFEPLQAVFVAGGSGPFELAVGRADSPAAAVPLSMLLATAGGKLDNVPPASVAAVLPAGAHSADGGPPSGWITRSNLLWAVLLLGVAVLGLVALGLFKQLKS